MNKFFPILFFGICFSGCGPSDEKLNQETLRTLNNIEKTLENNIKIYGRVSKVQNRYQEDAFLNDPIRVLPYKRKWDSISSRTNALFEWIEKIKKNEIKISKEELNIELKRYREFILSCLSKRDREYLQVDTLFIESLNPYSLVAMQNLVLHLKIDASDVLSRHIDIDYFRFDTLLVRVIQKSKVVRVNDDYQADIFLSAFSLTSNPVILVGEYDSAFNMVGKYDSVPVRQGVGVYTITPKRIGKYELKGLIRVKNPVDPAHLTSCPFHAEYEVVK